MSPAVRTDQPVIRFSTAIATTYIITPMIAVTSSPAKTNGTSNREEAWIMSWPMPLFDATVSAMMETTKATVMAIFSEEKQ